MNASLSSSHDSSADSAPVLFPGHESLRGAHIRLEPRRRTFNFTPSHRLLRRTRRDADGALIYGHKRLGKLTPAQVAAKVGAR